MLQWATKNKGKAAAIVVGTGLAWYFYQNLTYTVPADSRNGGSFASAVADKMKVVTDAQAKVPESGKIVLALTNHVTEKAKFTGKQLPDANLIPILILYGTEYGFAKELAEKLLDEISQLPPHKNGVFWPRVVSMEDTDVVQIPSESIILCCCSTQGDGVPPAAARPFFDYLEENSKVLTLPNVRFSVLALGDKGYPHFCRAGKTIDTMLESMGANRLHNRRDIDLEDWNAINGWMNALCKKLSAMEISSVRGDYLWEKKQAGELLQIERIGTKKRPLYAAVQAKRLLTTMVGEAEEKETFHLEFSLGDSEPLQYLPGDSLAVYAQNCSELVSRLLRLLRATGTEEVVRPLHHYTEEPLTNSTLISLRDALLKCFDLKNLKFELVQYVRGACKNAAEQTRLDALLKGGMGKENTALTEYLKGRELDDLLEDFPSAKVNYNGILANLKPLLPRFYSISSSQRTHPNSVTVTVAVVRYKTHSKSRKGVASTHMWDRIQIGDKMPIYVNKNNDFRLPKSGDTAIIMIGPGTGLAPFRSFTQERISAGSKGRNVLYFGCRNRSRDFLYREELEKLHADKQIELHTAFSREQKQKVYVQDRLRESAAEIWSLLEIGAHVYVCGDAQYMAGQVHDELLKIITTVGGITDARGYMEKLEQQRRYQRDIWF